MTRFVVIPDIHGRLDAFKAMLEHAKLVDRRMAWTGRGGRLIQLGDLIDRGRQVRACVELMMRLKAEGRDEVIPLLGNHEKMLLDYVKTPDNRNYGWWLGNGGDNTLASYGEDFEKLCRPGGAHYRFFKSLPVTFEFGRVLFVHGGLREANVKAMEEEFLLWDRPPLVRGSFEAVVSGHTPTMSGGIEEEGGVFQCDIGLGYHNEASLQYLVLDLEEGKKPKWEMRTCG